MVAFRNIAVHDDRSLLLAITVDVITQHLGDFCSSRRWCCSGTGANEKSRSSHCGSGIGD